MVNMSLALLVQEGEAKNICHHLVVHDEDEQPSERQEG